MKVSHSDGRGVSGTGAGEDVLPPQDNLRVSGKEADMEDNGLSKRVFPWGQRRRCTLPVRGLY